MFRALTELLPRHRPFCILGAEGTGKTALIKEFAQKFSNWIRLDLEVQADRSIFHSSDPPDEILKAISFIKDREIRGSGTLIVLDEIARCPEAIDWFSHWDPRSGSPLVIATSSVISPGIESLLVGSKGMIPCFELFPLSFEEFLRTQDDQPALDALREIPVPLYAYSKLLHYYHLYTLIGGMPAILREYSENRHVPGLRKIYEDLQERYSGSLKHICRGSRSRALAREVLLNCYPYAASRISFSNFGNLEKGSREIREAFRSLERSLAVRVVYPATSCQLPMTIDPSRSPRLHLLDTGLVAHFSGIQKILFRTNDMNAIFEGQMARQVVGQELLVADSLNRYLNQRLTDSRAPVAGLRKGLQGQSPTTHQSQTRAQIDHNLLSGPGFWVRSKAQSSAIVDFVMEFDGMLIPVVVRSGEPGRLRSLHQFVDLAPHPFAVRLSSAPPEIRQSKTIRGKTFYLLNLPYFLAGRIREHLTGFRRLVESPSPAR